MIAVCGEKLDWVGWFGFWGEEEDSACVRCVTVVDNVRQNPARKMLVVILRVVRTSGTPCCVVCKFQIAIVDFIEANRAKNVLLGTGDRDQYIHDWTFRGW